jgi:post-segregation antitoxin (ccd killing protein)
MAKIDVTLSLDEPLVAQARAEGGDLSTMVETALRRHLRQGGEDAAADRRWAEDNALMMEALAEGAEETKRRVR